MLLAAAVWWIATHRENWMSGAACVVLVALAIVILPAAFKQSRMFVSAPAIEEFADWRGAIAPANTVLVVPAQDVGGFVWFTLGRPNYLALDQSAGVVFSRATALEVQPPIARCCCRSWIQTGKY